MSATITVPRRERLQRSELAVLRALDAAADKGDGAVNDGGVPVDLAHARQARLIGQRAALIARHSSRAR